MAAPVRGARIVLTDDKGVRADMTASWLAQMGWEVYVLEGGYDATLEVGPPLRAAEARPGASLPPPLRGHRRSPSARCRPISTGNTALSSSSARDGTHGFYVI